ncbi:MAG: hypothetical protein QOH97_1911 [Actinoplanes sp.]|nr:hypothetical protein [Actinoplanes sp.]
MTDDHPAARPSWDCAGCGRPWPCDPARERLAGEFSGTYLTLFLAVDMVDAARDNPGIPPSEPHERFLAWTR